MHQLTINAAIQIVPLTQSKHPYIWVDEAIALIEKSGLVYEVGAFNTTVEGSYQQIVLLVNDINTYLQQQHCEEWICNVQYQIRANQPITAFEKVDKFR
jgi:uncharacterized protein YqgV (UPF0045/DUF77 family)